MYRTWQESPIFFITHSRYFLHFLVITCEFDIIACLMYLSVQVESLALFLGVTMGPEASLVKFFLIFHSEAEILLSL